MKHWITYHPEPRHSPMSRHGHHHHDPFCKEHGECAVTQLVAQPPAGWHMLSWRKRERLVPALRAARQAFEQELGRI
jgi:hypothetical protein